MINRSVVLRSRPTDVPQLENFAIAEREVPEPGRGQMLVRNLYLGVEAGIRTRLNEEVTYIPPIGLGEPIESPTLSEVVRSEHPDFKEGEILVGMAPWSEYALLSEETMLLERVQPAEGTPLSHHIGALGSSGITAYVGMHAVGDLQPGETVVVSAAAGAVGSVAGQIARIRGCRVVGLVGSADKAAVLTDRLGFDAAINYREAPDLAQAVNEACPDGVDVFFDNVGGPTLDAMLTVHEAARPAVRPPCAHRLLRHGRRLQRGRAAADPQHVGGGRPPGPARGVPDVDLSGAARAARTRTSRAGCARASWSSSRTSAAASTRRRGPSAA